MTQTLQLWLDTHLLHSLPVGDGHVLGRDPVACDLFFDVPGLSRQHAHIALTPGGIEVRDLGSKNGLIQHDERCDVVVLRPGDSVQAGPVRMVSLAAEGDAPWRWAAARLPSMATGSAQGRLEALVGHVREVTGAPDVWAVRWEGERLVRLAASGGGAGMPSPGGISRSIVAQVAQGGQAWWASDAAVEAQWVEARSVAALRSVGCVPLGEHGALFCSDPRGPDRFPDHVRRRVEALCAMAAAVIDVPAPAAPAPIDGVVGTGDKMHDLLGRLSAFAPFPYPMLLLGERGTGKSHLARAIHRLSGRKGAFVHANASAITETLAEDVLFGHVKGAFAGADRDKPGWVEQAEGGTLFLDEVGDLPVSVQPKLLVLLDQGTYQRVGGHQVQRFTGRIVAATNRAIDQGGLRRDLYDRLAQVVLRVPALREHAHDIPMLAESVRRRELESLGLPGGPAFAPETLRALSARTYAESNIRGLANDVKHALVLALHHGARSVDLAHLPAGPVALPSPGSPLPVGAVDHGTALRNFERELLQSALDAHDGNQTLARQALGLSHGAWYRAKARTGLS